MEAKKAQKKSQLSQESGNQSSKECQPFQYG